MLFFSYLAKMKNTITYLFLFLLANINSFAQIIESGDIYTKINSTISNMPGDSGNDYTVPETWEVNSFEQIFIDILAGNYVAAADTASTMDYQLVEFTETTITPNPTYYILEKTPASTKHWGTYIYNPLACRPTVVIQSPHPKNDTNTGRQGIHVFRSAETGFFFMSGTHRCNHSSESSCTGATATCSNDDMSYPFRISDMPHVVASVFHHLTELVFDNVAGSHFIQLHGFGKKATDPYIIASNGTLIPPVGNDTLAFFVNRLLSTDTTLTAGITHYTGSTRLAGRTNTQGRYINDSTNPCDDYATGNSGQFLHIEQEKTKLRDDITGWDKVVSAVRQTFPGTGCITLPVELYSFSAKIYSENTVLLNWATANEESMRQFEIEHSIDGIRFYNIGIEKAKNRPNEYLYYSKNIKRGDNYYRLKIIDIDGSFTYSDSRHIFWDNQEKLFIYPNPSNNYILYNLEEKNISIRIYSIMGKEIFNFRKKNNASSSIDISHLKNGNYIIKITTENNYSYQGIFTKM